MMVPIAEKRKATCIEKGMLEGVLEVKIKYQQSIYGPGGEASGES